MLFNLISFFGGFFASSVIDTSLGEFSEWAIVGSAVLVATIEIFNSLYFYCKKKMSLSKNLYARTLLDLLYYFKIGLIYGLIVDAFKLGS